MPGILRMYTEHEFAADVLSPRTQDYLFVRPAVTIRICGPLGLVDPRLLGDCCVHVLRIRRIGENDTGTVSGRTGVCAALGDMSDDRYRCLRGAGSERSTGFEGTEGGAHVSFEIHIIYISYIAAAFAFLGWVNNQALLEIHFIQTLLQRRCHHQFGGG